VIDGGDATLLPGLIDCHLHMAFDASADPSGRLAPASGDANFRERPTRWGIASVTLDGCSTGGAVRIRR
jgi:imidazolonepropionase-like amidohydrolase